MSIGICTRKQEEGGAGDRTETFTVKQQQSIRLVTKVVQIFQLNLEYPTVSIRLKKEYATYVLWTSHTII